MLPITGFKPLISEVNDALNCATTTASHACIVDYPMNVHICVDSVCTHGFIESRTQIRPHNTTHTLIVNTHTYTESNKENVSVN